MKASSMVGIAPLDVKYALYTAVVGERTMSFPDVTDTYGRRRESPASAFPFAMSSRAEFNTPKTPSMDV